MKAVLLSLICALSVSAMASKIQTADFFLLDGWQGEYPSGYEIVADTTVYTVTSPTSPYRGKQCTLKAKSVIHPWAQKTKAEFVTLAPVNRFVAAKDFEIGAGEEGAIKVRKGDAIIELTYLSEGICRFEVNGKEVDDSCMGVMEDDDRATLVSASPFAVREFFKTACTEGYEAWMDAEELSSLLTIEDSTVKSAEITDFGSVKEP